MKNWNIDLLTSKLKSAVKENKIYQWRVSSSEMNRKEFYLIQSDDSVSALDQNRLVSEQTVMVFVWVKKTSNQCGMGAVEFFPHFELEKQMIDLIDAAQLSTQEYWELPENPERVGRQSMTSYSPFMENLDESSSLVYKTLSREINAVKGSEFNSAELFIETFKKRQLLSNGFEGRTENSKIYAEVCFSYQNSEGLSEEFLVADYGVCPEQIDFKRLCSDSANYAKKSLETSKPKTANLPVVVESDVLGVLIQDLTSQLNASNKYYSFPFVSKGAEVVPEFTGDRFKVYLDPHLDYGFGSQAYDGYGVCGEKTLIIDNNRVQENMCSVEIGQFLEKKPTITSGNYVLEAEGVPYEELVTGADEVLEILQFSGLFTDPMSLTFSSEIRLARIHDRKSGEVRYIKGGNLSGNIKSNFKSVRFSSEKGLKNLSAGFGQGGMGYYGPKFALLSDVQISS